MTAYSIELESLESVVAGGVRRVTWLVERDSDWLIASDFPGAQVEQREGGAGVVWRRRVTLALPPGARLARVESAPKRAPPKDPLAYLFGPADGRNRQTRRSYFTVSASGKLERVPPRTR
jgi:hypothetical protein